MRVLELRSGCSDRGMSRRYQDSSAKRTMRTRSKAHTPKTSQKTARQEPVPAMMKLPKRGPQ